MFARLLLCDIAVIIIRLCRTERVKVVFVTARVHPGETPASFICHGLVAFLASDHDLAVWLRHRIIFKVWGQNVSNVQHNGCRLFRFLIPTVSTTEITGESLSKGV